MILINNILKQRFINKSFKHRFLLTTSPIFKNTKFSKIEYFIIDKIKFTYYVYDIEKFINYKKLEKHVENHISYDIEYIRSLSCNNNLVKTYENHFKFIFKPNYYYFYKLLERRII